ncbi:MAG: FHA domain-containing protein [Anaerolineales bacterium]
MTQRYRLTMRKGPMTGKVLELAKSVLIVGRELKNDIVVNDAEVSRQHARLTEGDNGWQIEDLAATNGTFVNGQRISAPTLLKPGDRIGFGETIEYDFTLVPEGEAAPAEGVTPESGVPAVVLPPLSSGPLPASPLKTDIPSFGLPPSTPLATPKPASGGVPAWAWAVGIGCGVIALLAVCIIVAAGVILFLARTAP